MMRWAGGQFFFRLLENEAEKGAYGQLNGSLTGKQDFQVGITYTNSFRAMILLFSALIFTTVKESKELDMLTLKLFYDLESTEMTKTCITDSLSTWSITNAQ